MMMISASSWVAVLVIFISFWVDHVNSLHCSNHHLPAASSRVIQQQYPCSVRHRPTAIHLDMRVVMRHTRISRLSLVHPSFCTHSIDSSSSSNIRKEMALQAGAPGRYVCVCMCMCMYVYMYVCVYVCVFMYVFMCVFMCLCVCVCVFLCVCLYVCVYVSTHRVLSPHSHSVMICCRQ